MKKLSVVVGGQFGSEAKGHVAAQLARPHEPTLYIRVAGPNAGHTVYDTNGQKFALRQIPVGAALGSSYAIHCALAAGSEVQPSVLFDEWEWLRSAGHNINMTIDPEATILTRGHITEETGMHERMGSTGKGIGAARAGRIWRDPTRTWRVCDDNEFMTDAYDRGISIRGVAEVAMQAPFIRHIVIEGTQGYGLGLHAGHYPQCTSSDTRAIDFLAMAGLNPWHREFDQDEFDVWVVSRVYPIRVAGNSGPLYAETTWANLGLPEEFTTVTKKVRRVGEWDALLVKQAVEANGGAPHVKVALTMLDQKFPEAAGSTTADTWGDDIIKYIQSIETEVMAPVKMVTTSPTTAVFI